MIFVLISIIIIYYTSIMSTIIHNIVSNNK